MKKSSSPTRSAYWRPTNANLAALEKEPLDLFDQLVLQHPLRRLGRQVDEVKVVRVLDESLDEFRLRRRQRGREVREEPTSRRRCNFDMICAASTLRY